MSRYSSRLRSLEGRLGLDGCPLCGSVPCRVVWGDDDVPPCPVCGELPLVVRWDMDDDDPFPRSQQAQTASTHPPSGPAGNVGTATDIMSRAVVAREPKVRRRRYRGH